MLTAASVSPARIIARASAILQPLGAMDPVTATTPLRINCAHVQVVTLIITYTAGGAGGAPEFQAEAFDGIFWNRITIENVGTMTIVGNSGDGSGTTTAVDQFIKQMTPRATFRETYQFTLNKSVYAIRFNFAEYPAATLATPGTLGAVVLLSSE